MRLWRAVGSALFLVLPGAAPAAAEDPPKAAAKEAAGKEGELPWVLPPAGHAGALLEHASEEKAAGGLAVKVTALPDGYRFKMAQGFDELRKAGYREKELREKVRALHAKHKELKGKLLFLVSVEAGGGKEHHFLQGAVKEHASVSQGARRPFQVLEEEPLPRFASWQVFEYPPDLPRKIYRKPLWHFKALRFGLAIAPSRPEDSTPIVVSLRNLLRVEDTFDRQKRDYRTSEGINIEKRQISTSSLKDQAVPEIAFTFYPGRWDFPKAPKGFDEFLDRLEKGR